MVQGHRYNFILLNKVSGGWGSLALRTMLFFRDLYLNEKWGHIIISMNGTRYSLKAGLVNL